MRFPPKRTRPGISLVHGRFLPLCPNSANFMPFFFSLFVLVSSPVCLSQFCYSTVRSHCWPPHVPSGCLASVYYWNFSDPEVGSHFAFSLRRSPRSQRASATLRTLRPQKKLSFLPRYGDKVPPQSLKERDVKYTGRSCLLPL